MNISTSDSASIQPFIEKLHIPSSDSHKGQNGRVLIIAGSSLFHASAIWASDTASHFVDHVHFASTNENNQILTEMKKCFHNGIVIARTQIDDYIQEDDSILLGPGMIRGDKSKIQDFTFKDYTEVAAITDEEIYTSAVTKYFIDKYPHKKFVFDAGALQMMKPEWLLLLQTPPIITPHQLEFERLFGTEIKSKSNEEKAEIVRKTSKQFKTIILLKAVEDIVSDGEDVFEISGGNQGLTKGGTGDILAGLNVALYAKNDPLTAAVLSSYILKKTADNLEKIYGYWYNNDNLIESIPVIVASLLRGA